MNAATDHVFHREGDYWSVVFQSRTVRVRDLKGLRYIARLLADPGREFHEAAGQGVCEGCTPLPA